MSENVFTVKEKRPPRPAMTVSRNTKLGSRCGVSWFSLGAGTDISRESYDSTAVYIGSYGTGTFLVGEKPENVTLKPDEMLIIPPKTLCGTMCSEDFVYTEIITEREVIMNDKVKAGEAIALKGLISYEEGSIANLDVVHNNTMKFVLMAFDEGTGLTPHRAPGNAIVTALEGKAVIGYEGKDYEVEAGQSFRFEKNGLHSVTAKGRFKLSLLLVLE